MLIASVTASVLLGLGMGGGVGVLAGEKPQRLYVAPGGTDASACTRLRPCLSFDRAYRRALPGQTVEVAGGVYPGQSIRFDAAKAGSSSYVRFMPAAGATVSLGATGRLEVCASYVWFQGVRLSLVEMLAGVRRGFDFYSLKNTLCTDTSPFSVPHHNVYENVNARQVFWAGSHTSRMRGGQVGDINVCETRDGCGLEVQDAMIIRSRMNQSDGQSYIVHDITIDGVLFHDLRKPTVGFSASSHADCLQIYSFKNVTVRNSRFIRCSDADIFAKADDALPAPQDGLLLENNFFANMSYPTGFNLQLADAEGGGRPCSNVVFRYNTVDSKGIAITCTEGNPAAAQAYGNILHHARDCSNATWRYNFYWGATTTPLCDRTETKAGNIADVVFVNKAAGDLHLGAGSRALGKGHPTHYPSRDIDGDVRGSGPADPGADQH